MNPTAAHKQNDDSASSTWRALAKKNRSIVAEENSYEELLETMNYDLSQVVIVETFSKPDDYGNVLDHSSDFTLDHEPPAGN